MLKNGIYIVSSILLAALICSCTNPSQINNSGQAKGEGWIELYNGKDFTGWTFNQDNQNTNIADQPVQWIIEADGSIRPNRHGDIWTKQIFGDFVLDLEFKVARNANSGIFLRCDDISNWLNRSIEMQVLDSYGREAGKHDCGAIYDILEPAVNTAKPTGEWNHVTITCIGSKINVLLNDQQVIDLDLNNWTQAHQNPDGTPNKFECAYKDMPRCGHIGLQDHGDYVWYRNIRLRELQ